MIIQVVCICVLISFDLFACLPYIDYKYFNTVVQFLFS